ncbi:LacI family transcriptional regulator [Christensenellaceae bacterium]|nr:LacI family transcriptional regulator [Christensenellaceae bacterium]BDF61908.1 LacI family transcriptional regulator [Christensenellaceae bacterium]
MKKRITMADIAAEVGVSQSAVSIILSGRKDISFADETIDKVHAACSKLGYKSARSLSRINSKTIMIMSENLTIPYYALLTQQIENTAHLHGYKSFICNTNRNKDFEIAYLEMATKMDVAGIICLTHPHCPEKFSEVSKKIPVIAVCDRVENLSVDIVEMDNYKASILLIDHLVELGHKKIMLLTASPDINIGRQFRLKGLKHQMTHYGLADSFAMRVKDVDWKSEMAGLVDDYTIGYELMQDPAILKEGFTAFIGMSDLVSRGIADALIEKGKRIPEDFSICGYDNLLYARLLPVSLTTIDHHIEQKGLLAFELLQRQMKILNNREDMDFQEARIKLEHPPVLVVRKSTGPAPR